MDPTAGGGDPTAGGGGIPMGPPDPSLIPSPPTPAAESLAYTFGGLAVALNVISFMFFSGRIATRTYPVFRLGWDDYVISAAWVLILANSTLLLLTVPYVFGGDPSKFTLQDVINGNRYAVLSQPIWAWSMAAIKISVAAMLLRLERERFQKRFLWIMIWLQLIVCVYNTLSTVLQCIPLKAAWDLMGLITDAKCWSSEAIRINSICISSFNIVTDVIFALMPVTFLKKLQIPLRERIIIGLLMGLGIFASAASIVKAVVAANFGKTDDPNREGINMGTWSIVEEQVAFVAACVPCLRSPFQSVLRKMGLVSTQGHTGAKPTAGDGYDRMGPSKGMTGRSQQAIQLKAMMSLSHDAQSEDSILPPAAPAATAHIPARNGEIWRTTEVHLDSETGRNSAQLGGGGGGWPGPRGRASNEFAEKERRGDHVV
ncbi:hypothetical protein B0H66DRAFT_484625 [Apodospora peruviana]|uniref:Rhodopsin domain-containing protein n=1 Tax=Apodospora peruviana TaxID=516989 RepID=A0AAE0LZL7_9PEZI|nr:hypothetical protein B0H66DRAFT_484625 [Apodospora peruviana]